MKTDAEIARSVTPRPIAEIADRLGISHERLIPYGRDKAKVELSVLNEPRRRTTVE